MNRRQKIIVSVTGIILILLILVGLTYAYFLTRIQGNTNTRSISVTTADLRIVYGDGTNEIITKNQIIPGTVIGEKDFTVTNEGNSDSDYIVVIDDIVIKDLSTNPVTNTTFESNDFVYTLTCVQKNKNTGVENGTCDGVSSETSLPLINNGLLVSNKIPENMRQEYVLTVTYKETNVDQSDDMNKELEVRINIGDIKDPEMNPYKNNTNSLAYNIINNARLKKNGTELRNVPEIKPATSNLHVTYGSEVFESVDDVSISFSPAQQEYWITYGTGYEVDESTGFKLTGVNTCKYSDSSCTEILVDKYLGYNVASNIASSTNQEKSTNNLKSIYRVISAPSTSSSTVRVITKKVDTIKSTLEKELSVTPDDFGTSYYYRGSVEDNFVDFAGMCWRIVRIEGDGTIKLVLEDLDTLCENIDYTQGDGNWNIPTMTGGSTYVGRHGYTLYAKNTLTASDGVTTNSSPVIVNDYINGQTDSSSSMATAFKNYQEITVGENKSLKDKIREVYNDNTLELNNYLKAGNWCLNDRAYEQSGSSPNYTYTELTKPEMLDIRIKDQKFYYDTYVRLYGKSKREPTLKCNGTVMNKFGGNIDMYVATLTADEIVFSGHTTYNSSNNMDYLSNMYQTKNSFPFILLSLESYNSSERVFYSQVDNYLSSNIISSTSVGYYLRPSVRLKPGITISSGEGTIDNPYVIQ